jgi:hypothetical protein
METNMTYHIADEKFNQLRIMSVAVCTAIKQKAPNALGLAGDLVNELIDIEGRHLDAERPLGADENIGSCEPGPLIRWDKTQSTWHTDIENVGRYSVRRTAKYGPFGAYLNGERVAGVPAAAKVGAVKRDVENRIRNAMQIAKLGHMITSK